MGLSYNAGGVESFVMNYYRYLVKKGIQFDFICMYGTLAYQEEIKPEESRIHTMSPAFQFHPEAILRHGWPDTT